MDGWIVNVRGLEDAIQKNSNREMIRQFYKDVIGSTISFCAWVCGITSIIQRIKIPILQRTLATPQYKE